MLSTTMQTALNDQIKAEWESEYLYLAFMAWCYNHNYDGFGAWFLKQAEEEHGHGMKIVRYLNEVGGEIRIPAIQVQPPALTSVEQLFKLALEHEGGVTRRIHKLVDLATSENDHTTRSFLQWFVDEQREEENLFRGIVAKLERLQGAPGGLFMLEMSLAQRES